MKTTDLLVIGSGAGGLAAAVTAAHLGLQVRVMEKDPQFGGTTAWSGGWLWVPRNPLAVEAGINEGTEQALAYLKNELGAKFNPDQVSAFLEQGPRMVEFFRRNTALQFIDGNVIPDFHGNTPGAVTGGRSLCAAPFDGRQLGARIHAMRPPLPETTLWGMGIASGAELRHFFNATRRISSFWYVAKLLARHFKDLLLYRRGMRLVNGNALTGALARSAFDVGVDIETRQAAVRLIRGTGTDAGRVLGAVFVGPQGEHEVRARYGVVLACGGFPHDPLRKKQLLPHAPTGTEHWSAAAPGNTGDGLRLGESVDGVVDASLIQAAALAPVSLVPRPDRTTGHFPHLIDRAKPGLIAVTSAGLRFTNEADSYHDFMQGLLRETPQGQPVQAWLLCDTDFIRRYGLGAAKPWPMPLRRLLQAGYLQCGRTWAELAVSCGIDAHKLEQTVARYNAMARNGFDLDYAKGQTPYNRMQGDPGRGLSNPCMAPIEKAPFYAVKVVAGSLGTFAGLKVNSQAQVTDAGGAPVAGLYACGNDMNSLMGGHYPSGGITLGPAMTFGYIAAHHVAKMKSHLESDNPTTQG